jgi:hypothetical protein
LAPLMAVGAALTVARVASADDVLHAGTPALDRPTLHALGVRLPLTGDDNFNATVAVRYRAAGGTWQGAMPLFRVHPELVPAGSPTVAEFAGSVFDLAPATTYDIELTAHDPDGGDAVLTLQGKTRPVPAAEPAHPHAVSVSSAASLQAALSAAQPGDVITLAAGMYAGEFTLDASGTADDPIVIRGVARDTVILDGGAGGGNVLAIEGSYTHVERLTLQHDTRALRFHATGGVGNVVRRVHARDVVLGFGSNPDQQDFYLCDNLLEGRLVWPHVYSDDQGVHANDDGIHVEGSGHVVCHNTISGFGDALKVEQTGARAVDFEGNDVNGAYDNDIELDQSSGNARAVRNRFTNGYMPISVQPIFGGPAYVIRNLVVNAAVEQVKFHNATVGVVVLDNTFVSPAYALQVLDSTTPREIVLRNNLCVGPSPAQGGRTVNWDQPMDPATDSLDYDGYFPDGAFHFGYGATGANYASFAAVVAGGRYEAHGRVLGTGIFASGLKPPTTYMTAVAPDDGALAAGSDAIDHGTVIANVTDGYQGAAPDLGAQETGCPVPAYGVRPEGVDESNEVLGCPAPGDGGVSGGEAGIAGDGGTGAMTGPDGGPVVAGPGGGSLADAGPTASDAPGSSSGCGCVTAGDGPALRLRRRQSGGVAASLLLAAGFLARRARRRR